MTTPTLGAQRVRLDFNPNSDTAVDRIKRAGAALIDAVSDEPGEGRSHQATLDMTLIQVPTRPTRHAQPGRTITAPR